jgi:amidophosphoribosyltransferase
VEGLYWAVCGEARNDARPQLADHYFTGDYPTRLADRDSAQSDKETQLSFLVDA